MLGGCSTPVPVEPPTSFAAYRAETEALVARDRSFQTQDPLAETAFNIPQEWRPEIGLDMGESRRGILLAHGLGDSPFSFSDVGPALARQGFLVRTVLLPGHGTDPADLIDVDIEDWRRVVGQQVALMKKDVAEVYLGGFSTGANLVTVQAMADSEIAGLLLFSPGFKSDVSYAWLTPLASVFVTWLREPDPALPQQNPVRYLNLPTNAFAQFHYSSVEALRALDDDPYDKPATIVLAEHDSVLDIGNIVGLFAGRFTHPESRLIWYGGPQGLDDPRVLVRPDYLPEFRISQFSHMSVLFAPLNPLYGREGTLRFCENGQQADFYDRCKNGEEVWYSDWGFEDPDRVHARLTYNPYFEWQMEVVGEVFGGPGEDFVTGAR